MRLILPLSITFITGIIMVLHFFVPHQPIKLLGDNLQEWYMIVASSAIFLGALNLMHVHVRKIKLKLKNWKYSPITILGFLLMFVTGLIYGVTEARPFDFLFMNVVAPMASTMFSLLAFFVASAAFRAFRASNWRATLLLTSAFIVMLGQVPIGAMIWDKIPLAKVWLMTIPNTAGQRAVMIGAAMGVVSTSLRMIFGIERSYLGGTD